MRKRGELFIVGSVLVLAATACDQECSRMETLRTDAFAALGFKDEIPFNIRVYDNDGKGFDGWMEYAPLDEAECPVLLKL